MKLLVVGAGGREHALCWLLKQSPSVEKVYCSPGSDAILSLAEGVPISSLDNAALARFASAKGIDLVIVGPEAPLANGLSDELRRQQLAVFGPSQAAARLESSKVFAKQFMRRHSIPTARWTAFETYETASDFLEGSGFGFPVVIKADGLAAGKGVAVCQDVQTARDFLSRIMVDRVFGSAGRTVILEECLVGEEVSYMVLCDGRNHTPLVAAQDHKRLLDGDRGPNTGGMGAYSLDGLLSANLIDDIESKIVAPVLRGMADEGHPFQGVLYVGLILTQTGPKVLEFNVRFGDPETQAVLMRFKGDWAAVLASASRGELRAEQLAWYEGAALCIVLAAEGYPESPRTGDIIDGLEAVAGIAEVQVFHAGTRIVNGCWQTSGGRILGVTARGSSLAEASARAYRAADDIHFAGMHFRRDIGARALGRH